MQLHAVVLATGTNTTGIEVPAEIVTKLGSKRPKVVATINGYAYRTSIASVGGRFLLSVSADVRGKAGVSAGDEVEVEIELGSAPREVVVPADLATALASDSAAGAAFDKLTYSHQQRHVQAIESAKAPATRERRVQKTIEMLRTGSG